MRLINKTAALAAIILGFGFFATSPGMSQQDISLKKTLVVEDVLAKVKDRYGTRTFCGTFGQIATLTGMGIQDTATGSVCFKHPDKMRWHYLSPEEQVIVSDGQTLWMYRPLDNQVIMGKANDFFKAGEGASFFSDIDMLKRAFDLFWAEPDRKADAERQNAWALKLAPKHIRPEFVCMYLLVDKKTGNIFETISYNNFGDETRLRFSRPEFDPELEDAHFSFSIPKGVDVIKMSP